MNLEKSQWEDNLPEREVGREDDQFDGARHFPNIMVSTSGPGLALLPASYKSHQFRLLLNTVAVGLGHLFLTTCMTCRILVPRPGIESIYPVWKGRVLTSDPGKSLGHLLYKELMRAYIIIRQQTKTLEDLIQGLLVDI